ncbi:hypothetical protein ACWWD9_08165 [Methylovorus sp. SPW-M1]
MKLEPNSLNISLERKDNLGYWLLAACALVILISACIDPAFASAFAASSIVGLPFLWTMLLSPKGLKRLSVAGSVGTLGYYLVTFIYIALAKNILIPTTLKLILHVFS